MLGDGAGTFFNLPVLQVHEGCAQYALEIEARMLVEAVVFHCDYGLLHVPGDVTEPDVVFPVGARPDRAAYENQAAEPVSGSKLPGICLLDGRRLRQRAGQEIADALPGAGREDHQPAGEQEGQGKQGNQQQGKAQGRTQAPFGPGRCFF